LIIIIINNLNLQIEPPHGQRHSILFGTSSSSTMCPMLATLTWPSFMMPLCRQMILWPTASFPSRTSCRARRLFKIYGYVLYYTYYISS